MFKRFPRQIKYIVGNEACERFSYYGMRAILVVFMTRYLMMSAEDATSVYHLFAAGSYLLPLLGSFISDRYLGKYRTIMILSIVYCLGHLLLALWENRDGLYWGLSLIAIGAGGIKPCVSAHVGDQFNEENQDLLERIFSIFYFVINFGAFFSSLLTPWVLAEYGPTWAFGIPGILMAIATLWFWLGRKHYIVIPPTRETGNHGFVPVLWYAIQNRRNRKPGEGFFDTAYARFSAEEVEGAKAAASIFKLFMTVSVFWALQDQSGSTWVLQASKMDLTIWGMEFEASQIQAINPIMVMLLIPLFSGVLYPAIERLGVKVSPLRKMSVGMLLAAISFVVVGLIQSELDAGNKLPVGWQVLAYFIMTCAEVMLSITGLEFAYTQAPRAMKSTIMSFWLLTIFVGNLLAAYVAKINVFQGAMFFYFFAFLMFLVAFVFSWSAVRYRVHNYLEKNSPAFVPAIS